jgi:hypothetical protein
VMEGKRDGSTGEVRKTRLFIYSEDFVEFFRLIKSAAEFIKAHPLPADVRAKREKYWAGQRQRQQDVRSRPAAAGARSRPPTHGTLGPGGGASRYAPDARSSPV